MSTRSFAVARRCLSTSAKKETPTLVSVGEARRFVWDCMKAVGVCNEHCEAMADVLISADQKGHFSHGINRLEMYVKDIQSGSTDPNVTPCVLKQSPATAWVDGTSSLGPVVGNFCMKLAISKACEVGIGWIVAKGSNHYGIASHYTKQALKKGMIGLSFTNTSPLMSPTRAKGAALGTNPLSVAAPAGCDSMVVDMATTVAAVGKIEMRIHKGEPIPRGWAQGPDGKETTDAELAFKTASLMPLGGNESNSGYKGYCLGLVVETFCGLLAGSAYGPNIRSWKTQTAEPANLGQCFAAINPDLFAPGFEDRMGDMLTYLRNMEPTDPKKPVLVPGDPENEHTQIVKDEGGIQYHEQQLKVLLELGKSLKVAPMVTSSGCRK